jgi:tRNA-dihydrouridine synthase B
MPAEVVIGGLVCRPALFCAPLAEVTHSAFRRLVAELGGCGAQFTEMLSGRHLLREDLRQSPYVKRRAIEKTVFYQLMLRPDDPVDRIIGRLEEVAPDGIDINLACYAPVIRQIGAGSSLFEDLPALGIVLRAVRKAWPGPFTVKIRLGHATIGMEERFVERLRLIEDCGVDAITLHTRFFEDKFKRRSRHELFAWASGLTDLPIIANGDITSPATVHEHAALFQSVAGFMVGRMAIAQPWIFAGWDTRTPVDHAAIWFRMHDYISEDFAPVPAIKRLRLFSKYYARNFQFGHGFHMAIHNAATMEIARDRADAFFAAAPTLCAEPSVRGM